MQSMQRSFGRMMQKSPGDNAKVAVLLNDYDAAENLLVRIVDQVGSYRDSWVNLAHAQLGIVTEYEGLYDPIVGAPENNLRSVAATPELLLERTLKLKEAYEELKTDLLEEVESIEGRVIKPMADARDCIAPIRKTIKKREKLRLDFENIQTEVNKLQRKPGKTPKDEKALAKAEAELGPRAEAFHDVDGRLKEVLPPIIESTFSMVPPILAALVMIQNRLLGLYYTTLHTYSEEFHFPLPPVALDAVVEAWSTDYTPAKTKVELISCVSATRGLRMPARTNSDMPNAARRSVAPGLSPQLPSGNLPRSSTGLIPSSKAAIPARPNRIPSNSSLNSASEEQRPALRSSYSMGMPTDFTTASRLGQPGVSPGLSPAAARMGSSDYFGRTSSSSVNSVTGSLNSPGIQVTSAMIKAKKKPPPPPPPKPRAIVDEPAEYVIALYAFTGQGSKDLSFNEGDRIKIVQKTETDQDWWTGELGGIKGSFPANYCRAE